MKQKKKKNIKTYEFCHVVPHKHSAEIDMILPEKIGFINTQSNVPFL